MNTSFYRQRSTWIGLLVLAAGGAACVWALNHPAQAADKPV